MAIWDIFKAQANREARVEGRITDLRVERLETGERWLFSLDSRPGEQFVFEPSALSPGRRRGERVVLSVDQSAGSNGRHRVDRIAAA